MGVLQQQRLTNVCRPSSGQRQARTATSQRILRRRSLHEEREHTCPSSCTRISLLRWALVFLPFFLLPSAASPS